MVISNRLTILSIIGLIGSSMVVGAILQGVFSNTTTQQANAVVGDKTTTLERGDKVPVVAYVLDKSDPSKMKAEGFSCTVLNTGDTDKKIETLFDCTPAKVFENVGAGEEMMRPSSDNETSGE